MATKKKSKSGRKSLDEINKIAVVNVWVTNAVIEKNGGKENCQIMCKNFLTKLPEK